MTASPTLRARVGIFAFCALLAGLLSFVGSPSISAAPAQDRCGNANKIGTLNPTLEVDRRTIGVSETATVQVTGRNFLVPNHQCGDDVFGGAYVFFGWVAPGGQWGPSHKTSAGTQGLFGTSFSYPGEGGGGEIRDDGSGIVRLVSFTRGGESGEATDFHMDSNGNWNASLVVRGATYSFKDIRTGATNTVDCRIVQCGVFTIGAHGKSSGTNERFTPINFSDGSGKVIAPSNPAAGGAGGATSSAASGGGNQPGLTNSSASGGAGGTAGGGTNSQGSGASTATTAAPKAGESAAAGSIGEAPAARVDSDDANDSDDARSVETENAAAVQVFDGDGDGSSGSGAVIGVAIALLVAAIAGAIIVQRRNRRGREVPS